MLKPLGVVMDPIEQINPKKDTTFALLLAAQQRDWPIVYMEARDLFLVNEKPYAHVRALHVDDDNTSWFNLGKESVIPLTSLSVILMRKDPPIDMHYIYTTQLLDKAQQQGVGVVNHPSRLRDFNEKLYTLHFPDCCPPSLVTSRLQAALEFLHKHGDIIAKPLNGMGGSSVFRLRVNDPNNHVILETLTENNQSYMMVQRYITEVLAGDKRIMMIDGEPFPYALARIPPLGETRANLAVGGKGKVVKLSKNDYRICQRVGPSLREKGLLFVGLDVIGDYLTEINITSPTGVREIDAHCEGNISDQFINMLYSQYSK
ncbi:glutathione synthase [Rickettsiella grylli]|uniref:Glutathione synthetase n=2 Tax=Rickettsiella grylli TaxID=59196 RepID=A8PN20_9COXI|nr:glutathione synthase [Rickettsiella grylli]EDP45993.1 glutathione synthase [Rickettsiella grylli]